MSALRGIHQWPQSRAAEWLMHVEAPLRTACWPHAETAIQHTSAIAARSEGALRAALQTSAAGLHADLAWHLYAIAQLWPANRHIQAAIDLELASTPSDQYRLAN